MERKHAQRLRANHPEAFRHKKPIVLGIPDDYRYMDPALQEMLQAKVSPFLSKQFPSPTPQSVSSVSSHCSPAQSD